MKEPNMLLWKSYIPEAMEIKNLKIFVKKLKFKIFIYFLLKKLI